MTAQQFQPDARRTLQQAPRERPHYESFGGSSDPVFGNRPVPPRPALPETRQSAHVTGNKQILAMLRNVSNWVDVELARTAFDQQTPELRAIADTLVGDRDLRTLLVPPVHQPHDVDAMLRTDQATNALAAAKQRLDPLLPAAMHNMSHTIRQELRVMRATGATPEETTRKFAEIWPGKRLPGNVWPESVFTFQQERHDRADQQRARAMQQQAGEWRGHHQQHQQHLQSQQHVPHDPHGDHAYWPVFVQPQSGQHVEPMQQQRSSLQQRIADNMRDNAWRFQPPGIRLGRR